MRVFIRRDIDRVMEAFTDWLRDLADEHDGYYGQPHGRTPVWIPENEDEGYTRPYWATDTRGYKYGYAGLVGREETIHLLLDVADEIENSMLRNDIVKFATDPSMPIGGWRTSNGNLTLVCGDIEYRDGRRHGVRLAMRCDPARDKWFYVATRAPNENPDACDVAADTSGKLSE